MATLPFSCRGPPESEHTRKPVPAVAPTSRCSKWPGANKSVLWQSLGLRCWTGMTSVKLDWSLFFNPKMRSQKSYAIWVITFTLLCSQACFRGNIFQDSRSCVQGNDSVIFNLVLFPPRDAPGSSPISPFDSHTHKLTHAKTFTNNYDLCNSHLFLCEVRKPDFADKMGDNVQI